MRPAARIVLCLAALIGCLAVPASAGAARDAEVSIMDDSLLLRGTNEHVEHQMALFQRLGIDRIRVSAFWREHAPNPDSTQRPASFDASNPYDPRYKWFFLDRVVASAARYGIHVMLSISTPAPMWATTGARRNNVWRPSAAEFGAYAEAVARRYGRVVDRYAISNEPNQGGWLQPQSDSRGLAAPHIYRAMVRAAYPRIKAADPGSIALIGELASSGSNKRGRRTPIRPLAFLRAMACVDRRYRPIGRGRCRNFQPIPADAVGHHPYQFFFPPGFPSFSRDDAAIGDGRKLLRVLDRLVRRGRIVPQQRRRLDVYYTEFGYQTDPPDPFAGIPLRRQRRWLQEAAYLVWRTPRIHELDQFRLTDGPVYRGGGLSAFREFQSGLLFSNRRKKPAFRSFPNPFVIAGTRFWGQVRPGGQHVVSIQRRRSRRGRFRTVRRVRTDARGYFSVRLRRRRGQWRYVYRDGPVGHSDTLAIR